MIPQARREWLDRSRHHDGCGGIDGGEIPAGLRQAAVGERREVGEGGRRLGYGVCHAPALPSSLYRRGGAALAPPPSPRAGGLRELVPQVSPLGFWVPPMGQPHGPLGRGCGQPKWAAAPPLGPCGPSRFVAPPKLGPSGTFRNLLESSSTLPEVSRTFPEPWKPLSLYETLSPDSSGAPHDV